MICKFCKTEMQLQVFSHIFRCAKCKFNINEYSKIECFEFYTKFGALNLYCLDKDLTYISLYNKILFTERKNHFNKFNIKDAEKHAYYLYNKQLNLINLL